MFKWLKNKFRKAPESQLTTMERLEESVDAVNYWWAKLEEEGNPDRVAPWMLWGKDRQLCLMSRTFNNEEVYHSPVIPKPVSAPFINVVKPPKRGAK